MQHKRHGLPARQSQLRTEGKELTVVGRGAKTVEPALAEGHDLGPTQPVAEGIHNSRPTLRHKPGMKADGIGDTLTPRKGLRPLQQHLQRQTNQRAGRRLKVVGMNITEFHGTGS